MNVRSEILRLKVERCGALPPVGSLSDAAMEDEIARLAREVYAPTGRAPADEGFDALPLHSLKAEIEGLPELTRSALRDMPDCELDRQLAMLESLLIRSNRYDAATR